MGNCGTHFCFLCGEPATRNSGHWTIGKPCPLYHRAGQANAQYDAQRAGPPELQDIMNMPPQVQAIADAMVAEIEAEARHFEPQADDPPEVRLRRSDRHWLRELRDQIILENDEAAGHQPAAWFEPLRSLLGLLQVLAAYYTIHLEEDVETRGLRRATLAVTSIFLAPVLAALPAETVERYPRVSRIVQSVMAGIMGDDMRAHAAERLADQSND